MAQEIAGIIINMALQVALSIITIVVALFIGLQLRRWLVRRLQKTVLDAWLVQTLGVLIVLPLLALAAPVALAIWRYDLFPLIAANFWRDNTSAYRDLTDLAIKLLLTALILALGIGIARTIMRLTIRGLESNRVDINIRTFIGRVFYIIILIIAGLWILSVWNVQLVLPVALISALAVAGAVAIQDILKDLVAGFYILIERPFFIGNSITTATYTGRVEDIQLRATKLRLVSGEEVTIPNSLIFTGIVINNSFYGERRSSITITLPQEQFSAAETQERILNAFKECEMIMKKPEPVVIFTGYAQQKITLTVRFWIATEQPATVSDVMVALHTLFPDSELAVQELAGNI